MNFNDRLADLRRRKGLSQEQLGYELGVSRQTVSKWELGQSYPDFQKLVLLSDYYEMSLDELVKGVDVGDVRALNESEKQISSIYSDVEGVKGTARKAWRAFFGRRLRRPGVLRRDRGLRCDQRRPLREVEASGSCGGKGRLRSPGA